MRTDPAATARAIAGAIGAVAALALAACAARGARVEAPVELAIAPIASLDASAGNAGVADHGNGKCSVRLTASRIEKSQPTCYLDEHISKGPGLLYYPCGGDGPAEADFGAQHYTGRITGGEVEVELITELDWEDGCRWGTQAVINGTVTVGNSEPVLKKLSWRYKDRVIKGAGCSGVCTARSTLDVSSSTGKAPAQKPAPVDDDDEVDD